MIYLVKITDDCHTEATNYGLADTVENLAKKIREDQRISWHYYLAPWFVRKKIGNDFRLIAKIITIPSKDITVVCFMSVFSKGDYEQNNFDPETLPSLAETEIEDFVNSELSKGELPNYLEQPTFIERSYLNLQNIGFDSRDGIVYESYDWVENIKTESMREFFVPIYKLVDAIVWDSSTSGIFQIGENFISKDGIKIIYHQLPEKNITFLINVIKEGIDHSEHIEKYRKIIEAESFDEEKIRQASKRAYPLIITTDSEIWRLVQRDETANLALSSEETEVLESVSRIGGKVYPLFINGRPGSGKSTILQYLFAKHLLTHIEKPEGEQTDYPPLYLTYSKKLLDVSIANIRNIVRLNVMRLSGNSFKGDIDNKFDNLKHQCFGEFHKFLFDLLPEDDRKLFDQENRIDFSRFRKLFLDNKWRYSELKNLSPELVWHVIRSYIKGMCDENGDFFDVEDYEKFDSKRKTVTQETFAKVFNIAWNTLYKPYCEENNFWDNQDLTRKLLDYDISLSKYPVVFCDEAQDFTPNELELILRLSLFSRRQLQAYELKQVPFAFAGDPFQTLNPTGFDWSAMQATFHEKVLQELDRTNQANLTFNYQELAFNYRSSKNIVGLCNLIQLIRGVIFEKKRLDPQKTWSRLNRESIAPEYFDISNTKFQRELSEQSDIVIILPCQDGDEENYIENDFFLKQLVSAGKNLNILSSMGAKGQEFSKVVLYKFGEDCYKHSPDLINALNSVGSNNNLNQEIDREKKLSWEYFINRLYVAASRPKRHLIIADTKEAIGKFWQSKAFTSLEELVETYKKNLNIASRWTIDDLSLVSPGNTIKLIEGAENDLLSLAIQFRDQGRATRSPYLLKLAANNFRNVAGHETDACICEAERYKLENKLENAAEEYLKIQNNLEALNCYWKVNAYKKIAGNNNFQNTSQHRASQFMISDKNISDCEDFLSYVSSEIKGEHKYEIIEDENWKAVVKDLVKALHTLPADQSSWKSEFAKLKVLEQNNFEIQKTKELAELAFRAGEYSDSIRIWKKTGGKYENEKTYIISIYEDEKSFEKTPENLDKILNAYLALSLYERAFNLVKRFPSETRGERLLEKLPKTEQDLASQTADAILNFYLRHSNYLLKTIKLIQQQRWDEKQKGDFNKKIINEFDVSVISPNEQPYLLEYLKKTLKEMTEIDSIQLRKIGTAFDKFGRFVDALVFYESVLEEGKIAHENDISYAKNNWLLAKRRQWQLAKDQRKHKEANRYKEEAKKKAIEWMIELDEFSDDTNVDNNAVKLPEVKLKAILAMNHSGMSVQEIASVLNISQNIVEQVIEGKNVNELN